MSECRCDSPGVVCPLRGVVVSERRWERCRSDAGYHSQVAEAAARKPPRPAPPRPPAASLKREARTAAPKPPVTWESLPCVHRGAYLTSLPCCGKPEVYQCKLYRRCTLAKREADIAACAGCSERQPPDA